MLCLLEVCVILGDVCDVGVFSFGEGYNLGDFL